MKSGSMLGDHEIQLYDDHIVVRDTGGIFATAKTIEADFQKHLVCLRIKLDAYDEFLSELTFTCEAKNLEVSCALRLEQLAELLFNMQDFIVTFEGGSLTVDGLIKYDKGITYTKLTYEQKTLTLTHAFGTETYTVSDIKSIYKRNTNVYKICTKQADYEICASETLRKILQKMMKDHQTFQQLAQGNDSINCKYGNQQYMAFVKDDLFEIYDARSFLRAHYFHIDKIELYLGDSLLLCKHEDEYFICENGAAKAFCLALHKVPKKLHEFKQTSYYTTEKSAKLYKQLACFIENRQWHFYNILTNRVIMKYVENEVAMSSMNEEVLVLPKSLLYIGQKMSGVESTLTPPIYFSQEGFPLYFERVASTVRIQLPDVTLLEQSVYDFYQKAVTQDGEMLIIQDIAHVTLCMPIEAYKKMFKSFLYELRTPTIEQVHSEKVLLSRARNLSDIVLFEFFGQWQIILDYVREQMQRDIFTEEEITQYGLYIYHATFQQRKRMDEIAHKFPQFMYMLSKDLMLNPKLSSIYQKQQREMFQLSAQMKSTFMEIENLLSQITYIHYNNDFYEQQLKEAQMEAAGKKLGTSIAAGIGISLLTGGIGGLLVPAMTFFSEWINNSHREKLDAIQKEKEFKKNTFLFKKAIDLIMHMSNYTMRYYIQMLNQLTYRNLRLEAEILASDDTTAYKKKLLAQSIDAYTKVSLPIDYDTQLKPQTLLQSLLALPEDTTVNAFTD